MADFFGTTFEHPFSHHARACVDLPVKKSPDRCLREFRDMMESRSDIIYERSDDAFLVRFLQARKYRVEESFQLFLNYHQYRRRNPELFERLDALDVLVQQSLRDGFPTVLDNRDRKGRTVLVFLASRWRHNCYTLINIYRALILTLEALIDDHLNQIRGFAVIVDWTEFSFKNSTSMNPRLLKTLVDGLQDCFPARIKGVHFIGQPWYVEAILSIVRPFLKEKSRKKIYLHGNNVATLHEHISKDVLPAELGGEGAALNPMKFTQKLIDIALIEAAKSTTAQVAEGALS